MIRKLSVVICLLFLPVHGNPLTAVNLGSGHRGLVFTCITPEKSGQNWDTVAFACDMKPGYPVESVYLDSEPEHRILLQETLTPDYLNQFDPRFWEGWSNRRLYSFGPDAAFAWGDLYRIEGGHIRIYPDRAQAEARKVYGLAPDERFLGAFEGWVFYWIRGRPTEVYGREGKHLIRFKLDKRVTEPNGMSKGDPKGDLALFAVAMPRGWFSWTPRVLDWYVLNFKDAERVR